MTDPDRTHEEPRRNDTALWVVVGLMALIVVGGLAYGLSYPSLHASNPPQTTGSGAEHARNGSRL
jgi:hypothetical protein